MPAMKVEKDVAKAVGIMEEASGELGRKKQASAKVKGLRSEIHAAETEAAQLTAQHQHLQRQMASLSERLQRLEHQVCLLILEMSICILEAGLKCYERFEKLRRVGNRERVCRLFGACIRMQRRLRAESIAQGGGRIGSRRAAAQQGGGRSGERSQHR